MFSPFLLFYLLRINAKSNKTLIMQTPDRRTFTGRPVLFAPFQSVPIIQDADNNKPLVTFSPRNHMSIFSRNHSFSFVLCAAGRLIMNPLTPFVPVVQASIAIM